MNRLEYLFTSAERYGWPRYLALFVFVVICFRSAWMADDAYITLRTVDNFVNGHGLTWNVAERVQAYTHPLWMFLLTAFYVFTREAYFTTLVLSLVVSGLAAFFFATRLSNSLAAYLFALTGLTASKAYVDYSTSGLECRR